MSSKYAEMVEDEAAEAEAEADDIDPEPVPTPEPEPEPEAAPIGEKAVQQMERENLRHVKRVSEIMGADFVLAYPCTACEAGPLGFVFAQPASEPEYQDSPQHQRCESCAGLGQVKSGATNEPGRLVHCPTCSGNGYVYSPAPTPQPFAASVQNMPAPPNGLPTAPPVDAMIDAWGRRPGHKHWGLPPDSIGD